MENESLKIEHLYKLCPKCSFFCHKLEPDKYCSLCGTELIDSCPSCHKSISNPYAKYCKECGAEYPGKIKETNHCF